MIMRQLSMCLPNPRNTSDDGVPTPKLIYVIDVIRFIHSGWFRASRSAAFLKLLQETR